MIAPARTSELTSVLRETSIFAYDHAYQKQPDTFARNDTEAQLLHLSRELLEAIMTCDTQHPNILRLLASDFRATHDRFSPTALMTIDEFLNFVTQLKSDYFLDTQLEILEEWVDFEENPRESQARVWRLIKANRYREGLLRDGLREVAERPCE